MDFIHTRIGGQQSCEVERGRIAAKCDYIKQMNINKFDFEWLHYSVAQNYSMNVY
jgi:hypothetical protein